LAATLTACSADSGDAAPTAAQPAPVTVAAPVVRDVPVVRSYPGHVEAVERVEVRPRVSGYIQSVNFKEGEVVHKGAVLLRIDARPYAAAVAEAEAALAKAEAEAALAERERRRAMRLLERQAASGEEAERRAAEAQVARSAVAAATAALARARLDLEHTKVIAPIAGRIGRAEVTAGNLVNSDDRLAVLVSNDDLYIRFDIDEKSLAGTSPADWTARFTLPEATGRVYEGPLAFLDNEVAAGTGTLRARMRVRKPDETLVPGRYGQVQLVIGERRNALLVDEKALGADQGARFLLVMGRDDTLEYRPVSVGSRVGPYRVIEQGLEPGERVVVTGLMRVRPGMPVAAREIAMAEAAGETGAEAPANARRVASAGGES
jgi:RND family efflux transporter MFP subunit